MADPFTWASIGTVASAGGGILSAVGAARSGAAGAQMYRYQAGMARFNRDIARGNADYAITSGETEASLYGLKAGQRAGAIKAAQGASGIDVGSGSSESVRESQAYVTGLDQRQIRENAARKAYGFEIEAAGDETQAGLYDAAAKNTKSASRLAVASSLLSGASGVASKWLQASKSFGGYSADSDGGEDA